MFRAGFACAVVLALIGASTTARAAEAWYKRTTATNPRVTRSPEFVRALRHLGLPTPGASVENDFTLHRAPSGDFSTWKRKFGASNSKSIARLTTTTSPFRRSVFTEAQQANGDVLSLHARFEKADLRLAPPAVQERTQVNAERIVAVFRDQLGRNMPLRTIVFEGSEADPAYGPVPTASKLRRDGIIVTREAIALSSHMGELLDDHFTREPARNPLALMRAVATNPNFMRARSRNVSARARQLADDGLAGTLAHESGHGYRNDANLGTIDSFDEKKSFEVGADLIGADISMRAKASPAAVLGFSLWASIHEAQIGGMESASHPDSARRYRTVHGYLNRLKGKVPATIDASGNKGHANAPYMDAAMLREFEAMPTPEELDTFLATVQPKK